MNLGLFDLPAPVFAALDQAMGFLPALVRLLVWALLSAIATMWLYRIFSKQEQLAELKPQIKSVQKQMARYDGPLDGLWPLIGKSMRLSGRQMGLTLWPALIASLPILFVLVFLSNAYGYQLPDPGGNVAVRVQGAREPSGWRWPRAPGARFDPALPGWQLSWPQASSSLIVPGYGPVLTLPLVEATTVVHKRQWWNWLIGNPAGYLPEDAPADSFHVALPRQDFLPFGPDWLGYWEVIYLTALVVFSLLIKYFWKIH